MKMMLPIWLTAAFVSTIFAGVIYLVIQQNYRISANDPQIQVAEDGAEALNNGQPLSAVVPTNTISVERSLATFMVLYDMSGKPINGNAELAGSLPQLPQGVFDYAKQHGEDRFTWQPEPGIRDAVVVVAYRNGYVMAGRSIREVERREDQLLALVLLGWGVAIVGSFVLDLLINRYYLSSKKRRK